MAKNTADNRTAAIKTSTAQRFVALTASTIDNRAKGLLNADIRARWQR